MDYKAVLKFLDGSSLDMTVPGKQKENGAVYVPESIETNGRHFRLDRDAGIISHFQYNEVQKALPHMIPKDGWLH